MKATTPSHRRTAGLLLAAAALPLTPLFAQETQPPADPPAQPTTTTTQPPADPEPAPVREPAPEPQPEAATPPAAAAPAPRAAAPVTRAAPRAAPAPAPRNVRAAPPVVIAPPAPIPVGPAPAGTIGAAPPLDAGTLPGEQLPVEQLPAPATTGEVDVVPQQAQAQENPTMWPWLLGLALLLGAAALFLLRRRPRGDRLVHDRSHEHVEAPEPVMVRPEPVRARPEPVAAAPEPIPAAPVAAAVPLAAAAPLSAAAPLAAAPVVPIAPVADTEAAVPAAAAEAARPWLDLSVRPARAGVTGEDAVVEFELAVENQGSAPALDVRISTWLFPAGPGRESEMERMLIERDAAPASDAETLPEVTIEPGQGQRIETAVHLATSGIEADAVLPVLFAEARYRLPDGSEGRTSASFAVGVPDGEELAYFGLDNPSGLHEGVVAKELGEPERA